MEDEREEGEIVDLNDDDFYENIISSDEVDEDDLRQRIEELEAKNSELEKIASISKTYDYGEFKHCKKKCFIVYLIGLNWGGKHGFRVGIVFHNKLTIVDRRHCCKQNAKYYPLLPTINLLL